MVTGPKAVKVCCQKPVKASGSSDGDKYFKQRQEDEVQNDRQDDLRVPSTKYPCVQCAETYYKSEIYINLEDPSMDWQGSLNLICRQCWNDNHKEHKQKQWTPLDWRRSCRQQWLTRQINSEEHFKKRVRIEAWKQAKEDIEAQYEGETRN